MTEFVDPEDTLDPDARAGLDEMAILRNDQADRPRGEEEPRGAFPCAEGLLDEHFASVFRYAYRLAGNAAAADDIAQEVFLRALKNLHQLRDAGAARGWLFTIVRNEFARWCRKFAPPPSLDQLEITDEGHEMPSGMEIDQAEWVQQSLALLPTDFRVVVVMYYFEQLTYAQIAEELSIPIGTVMSRLSRGRAQLKISLTELAEPNKG